MLVSEEKFIKVFHLTTDRDKNRKVTIQNRFLRKILLVDCQIECQMNNFIKKQKQQEQARKTLPSGIGTGLAMY